MVNPRERERAEDAEKKKKEDLNPNNSCGSTDRRGPFIS